MTLPLFRQLQTDWEFRSQARSTRRRYAQWRDSVPDLATFDSVTTLVDFLRSGSDRGRADCLFAAMVGLAADDDLAAQAVLEGMRYALVETVLRYRRNQVMTPEETEAFVIATAFEKIRTYPLERRPRAIAANLALDTRQAVSRLLRRRSPVTVPLDTLTDEAAYDVATPTGELLDLVAFAVRRGRLEVNDARLIVLTRVFDEPLAELAAERGILPHSLRRARLRAEHTLSGAVA